MPQRSFREADVEHRSKERIRSGNDNRELWYRVMASRRVNFANASLHFEIDPRR